MVVGSLGLLFSVFYDDLTLEKVSFVETFAIFFLLSFLAHFLVRALLYNFKFLRQYHLMSFWRTLSFWRPLKR